MIMNHTPESIRKFFSNTVLEEKAMTNELALLFRTSNSKNTGEIIREVIIPALSQSETGLKLLPVPTAEILDASPNQPTTRRSTAP